MPSVNAELYPPPTHPLRSLETGQLELVQKMIEAEDQKHGKQVESFVSIATELANSVPKKKAVRIAAATIGHAMANFMTSRRAAAFSKWRSFLLEGRDKERNLLLQKLKEEVIDSHARENEIVALLSAERRRAAEEQIRLSLYPSTLPSYYYSSLLSSINNLFVLSPSKHIFRLHAACRAAEAEKHSIIMQVSHFTLESWYEFTPYLFFDSTLKISGGCGNF